MNESLVNKRAERSDLAPVYVKATGIALEHGDVRMANMAMLGAVIKKTSMVPLEVMFKAMEKIFPSKIKHLVSKNQDVMRCGYESV